ncbi:MAG: PDZ domain-containing protein [Clostridia bacterium]|nr:PDZ domain-containing protein [Clostridia bacterium]
MSERKRKRMIRAVAFILAIAMLVMTGFYIFAMTGWFSGTMEKRGAFVSAATFYRGETPLKYRVDALSELVLEVQEMYKDEVSLDTLFNGIYHGLFESLNDPWSVFYASSETANQLIKSIEGEYGGIGITMRMASERVMITAIVVDSPAYHAGIKSGDYIVKVDNVETKGMLIDDVALLVRGEAGTSVTLTVEREGVQRLFKMNRQVIKTVSVSSKMMEGQNGVGYIKISSFDSNTDEEFLAARLALLSQGMNSMIIDLRDNGGGLMNSALDVADQLIPTAGYITHYERQGSIIESIKSTPNSTKNVPIVVLINEHTASASECLVGALKERGIATVIGETTYGKGVAQIVSDAGNGSALKLSTFYFLTPNKARIDGNGITPNIVVNSSGHLTQDEIQEIEKVLAPMTESVKYYAGGVGLNVYAAQQRLQYLDYDLELTAIMDEQTVLALKKFQADHLLYPYGGLDFTTTKALVAAFNAYINPTSQDLQLEKAIELLVK